MRKIFLTSFLLVSSVFATDYSGMTLDEMLSARGTIAQEDRESFRTEFQSKTQDLSPEEKAALKGYNTQGQGIKQQLRDGSGSGNNYGGCRGGGFGGRGGGGRR